DAKEFDANLKMLVNGKRVYENSFTRSEDGRIFKWNSYLEALSGYKIVIKKDVKDIFDRALNENIIIKFKTLDAPPALDITTGINAIEAEGPGFEFYSRNTDYVDITCAPVTPEILIKAFSKRDIDFYPWINEKNNIKWAKLKSKPEKNRVNIKGEKNRWKPALINLSKVCNSKASGNKGLFLAQFDNLEIDKISTKRGWGTYPYRLLGNVTNLGVLLKTGSVNGLVWVTGLNDGKPVDGALVDIYSSEGKKLASSKSNGDGIATIPGVEELKKKASQNDEDHYSYSHFYAVVKKGDDVAIMDSSWDSGISPWNFNISNDYRGKKKKLKGFIQSDRGIYKPGETVYFKGIVREVSIDKSPFVPKKKEVSIKVNDPDGKTFYTKKLKLDKFGGFYFDLVVDNYARLGDYYVSAELEDQIFYEEFSVEEFKPVTFEIKNKRVSKIERTGRPLKFSFDARYLFGPPVKDSKAYWSVYRRTHNLYFKDYAQYNFSKAFDYYDYYYMDGEYGNDSGGTLVSDGELITSQDGRVEFSFKDSDKKIDEPVDYIGRVTITDKTEQTVTKKVIVTAHPTSFYVGIKTDNWIVKAGNPVKATLVSVKPDGEKTEASGKLELIKEEWKCNYRSVYNSYSTCKNTVKTVFSKDVVIGKEGLVENVIPKVPGDYLIQISGKDKNGKTVLASESVWVTGKNASWVDRQENHKMTLIPSKPQYKVGETATVIPKYDTSKSTMLVTVERDGILSARIIDGVNYGSGIDVEMKENFAPNVYLSVAAVTKRTGTGDENRPTFALGIVDLKVDSSEKRLSIKIDTDKKSYHPGDKVKGKLTVTLNGNPVVSQLAVSVADEGVLQLINFKTPDPMNYFYSPWSLGVDTSSSYLKLLRVKYPDGASEEGSDSGGSSDSIRSKFVASAYWNPAVETDKNGIANFEFIAPDNLTAFRIMASGATIKDSFGNGESRITVSKEVLAKPVLPRFFAKGDTISVGAAVYNYSKKSGTAHVTISSPALHFEVEKIDVPIKKGESQTVLFKGKAGDGKLAEVTVKVSLNSFKDAFKVDVPLRQNLVEERVSFASSKIKNKSFDIKWPADIIKNESSLEIQIDRYGLGMFSRNLENLIKYPYGCLEQTMSKLIPMVKVKNLIAALDIKDLDKGSLDKFIKEGINKIYHFQDDENMFSLWIGGTGNPHLTAYALYGLSEIEASGVAVKKSVINSALGALKEWSSESQNLTDKNVAAQLAMIAFIQAKYHQPDDALIERLYNQRNHLPVYAKGFLLRAINIVASMSQVENSEYVTRMDVLTDDIKSAVKNENGNSFIDEESGLDYLMSSPVRTTAMIISALIEVGRELPLVDSLVQGMIAHTNTYGEYYNTQENLYTLVAFNDYISKLNKGPADVTIKYDDKIIFQDKINGQKVSGISIPLSQLVPGKLSVESSEDLYINGVLVLKTENRKSESISKGISVKREYIDLVSGLAVTDVKKGELVKVKLTVTTDSKVEYLALEDPLVSGFEPVNTKFETQNDVYDSSTSVSWQWDYTELRNDRMTAFADKLSPGERIIEYIIRAAYEGEYNVPPAIVVLMYKPATFGRTDSKVLRVFK
ncbi:MAG: hypothetical protein JXR91_04305, partial [Deltaproteobacteria bacterium]|nr:hypothetical protein [Deltaproteobacteria bacterium]